MAAVAQTATPPHFDWRRLAVTPAAICGAWAIYCLLFLAALPFLDLNPSGTDDYMRLLQVRDLLAGQPWFDVTQFQMDPPHGASMHWSRLVDLPLAAVAALFGERAALVLIPLLYLLPALFALQAIMKRLGLPPFAILLGLAIVPLFPLLPSNFAPMRIDHHAPQAVAALWCAALLLHDTRRSAMLSGLLAATWLAISLEALPLVAALAGLFGLRYLLGGERLLAWFLGALALAAPLLSLATRPMGELTGPYCDILLPGHMAGFAAAFLVAAGLPFAPWQGKAGGRLAGLCVLALASALPVLFLLGSCLASPFAQMDPLVQTYWHALVLEGLPVWRQLPSVVLMILWTGGLVAAGWLLARRLELSQGPFALPWTLYTLFALATFAYSLLLMREALVAQLVAIPFSALLLAHFLPRARALGSPVARVVATFGVFVLVTPTFASAALKPLDTALLRVGSPAGTLAEGSEPCDYARLAALPRGRILAPLDRGPEILYHSPHTVVASGYHRNQARMRDVIAAFTGSLQEAEAVVRANQADYVLVCTSEADTAVYRSARTGDLADLLATGRPPEWLQPAPEFANGSLRLYRVVPRP